MANKLIVLNPGHTSKDDRDFLGPETEGGNNRKTVDLIKKYLDEYIVDVKIVAQDTGTPFNKLGSLYPGADLFYSHHTNSWPEGKGTARGTEVFYHYGRTLAQNIAVRTAKILETVTRDAKKGDKGAKRNTDQFDGAGYAVIRQAVNAGVKYQLMGEIGFHDNPNENKLMQERRDEIARAIAEEIAKYLNLEKKKAAEPAKPAEPASEALDVAQKWAIDAGIAADRGWTNGGINKHTLIWVLYDFYKLLKKEGQK